MGNFYMITTFFLWLFVEQVKGDVEGARRVLRQVAYTNRAAMPPGILSLSKSSSMNLEKQGS